MSIYFSDAAQTNAAHVINFAKLSNNTRATCPASSGSDSIVLLNFGNYNKQEANSILHITGFVHGWGDNSGAVWLWMEYGYAPGTSGASTTSDGTKMIPSAVYKYAGDGYAQVIYINGYLSGHTTTGTQNMGLMIRSGDTANNEKPFNTVNPSNSDDGRLGSIANLGSTINIMEIL